jgi:hypothetical protein
MIDAYALAYADDLWVVNAICFIGNYAKSRTEPR